VGVPSQITHTIKFFTFYLHKEVCSGWSRGGARGGQAPLIVGKKKKKTQKEKNPTGQPKKNCPPPLCSNFFFPPGFLPFFFFFGTMFTWQCLLKGLVLKCCAKVFYTITWCMPFHAAWMYAELLRVMYQLALFFTVTYWGPFSLVDSNLSLVSMSYELHFYYNIFVAIVAVSARTMYVCFFVCLCVFWLTSESSMCALISEHSLKTVRILQDLQNDVLFSLSPKFHFLS